MTHNIPQLQKTVLDAQIRNLILSSSKNVDYQFVHTFEPFHDTYKLVLSDYCLPHRLAVRVFLIRETDILSPNGHYFVLLSSPEGCYVFDSLNLSSKEFKDSFNLMVDFNGVSKLTNYPLQADEMPTCGYWVLFAIHYFLFQYPHSFVNYIHGAIKVPASSQNFEELNKGLYRWYSRTIT